MPFCTIEEAWGENIYKTSQKADTGNLSNQDITYTNTLEKHNTVEKQNKKKNRRKKKSSKSNNIEFEDYIQNLKKENDELRNTIEHLNNKINDLNVSNTNNPNNLKMGIIDIILYILTGIFIIFIIDIILKFNNKKNIVTMNDNIF
jgi:ATP-dependent Zn protease